MAVHPASHQPQLPFLPALRALRDAVERRLEATWRAVDSAARRIEAFAELVGARSMTVAEAFGQGLIRLWHTLRAVPGIVLDHARQTARVLLRAAYAVVVTFPRWLFVELPRSVAAGVLAFLTNEVVPTSQFFVEVPLNLGGAAARDVFIRVPYWLVTDGTSGMVQAARWLALETVVLISAVVSRVDAMATKLFDAALWTLSILEGGLHWIAIDVIWASGPFLMSVASDVAVHALELAHAAFTFLVAARLWLWQAIVGLPDLLANIAQALFQSVQSFAETLGRFVEALWALIEQMPPFLVRLMFEIIPSFLGTLWQVVSNLLRTLLYDVPLAFINLAADLVNAVLFELLPPLLRAMWDLFVWLAQMAFVELPKALWDLFVRLVEVIVVDLPSAVWNAFLAALQWTFHDLPIALWNAFVDGVNGLVQFLFVGVPDFIGSMLSAGWEFLVALWEALIAMIEWAGRRLSTSITWALAIAISPFYLLWRLGGFGHGPQPRHPA